MVFRFACPKKSKPPTDQTSPRIHGHQWYDCLGRQYNRWMNDVGSTDQKTWWERVFNEGREDFFVCLAWQGTIHWESMDWAAEGRELVCQRWCKGNGYGWTSQAERSPAKFAVSACVQSGFASWFDLRWRSGTGII